MASVVKALMGLARLRMTIFSAVTYSTAATIGAAIGASALGSGHGLELPRFVLGWAFVLLCQLTAHFLGEYHDLPSDKYNFLASPFTGGSQVLISSRAVTPEACKRAGHICAAAAAVLLVWGLPLDGGREEALIPLGFAMIALAHQYSAPPFLLNHRAWGETTAAVVMNILLPYFGALLHIPAAVYADMPWIQLHRHLALLVLPAACFKYALFIVLNWADRRADFLGGKITLALAVSPNALYARYVAAMVSGYACAAGAWYLLPETRGPYLLAYIGIFLTLPLAHKLILDLHPRARQLSAFTVFLSLQHAPLPVLVIFACQVVNELRADPAMTYLPTMWIRLVPLLPYIHMLIVRRPPPKVMVGLVKRERALHAESQVVIVGAGIAGVVAALELRAAGVPFLVLEKRPRGQADRGADLAVWPAAAKVLRRWLPSAAWWHSNSFRIDRVFMDRLFGHDDGTWSTRPLRQVNMAGVTAPTGEQFRLVARSPLMTALADQLGDDDVLYGARVLDLDERQDHILVRYAYQDVEHTVRARLVIGADGVQSVCRRAMLANAARPIVSNDDHVAPAASLSAVGNSEPRYAGEVCYRGLIDFTDPDPAVQALRREFEAVDEQRPHSMPLLYGVGLRASFSFINETKTVGCWWVKEASDERYSVQGVGGWRARRKEVCNWPEPLRQCHDLTRDEDLYLQDIVDREPQTSWCSYRIVLVGDAAHPVTPNMGQGANMAIEDVAYLVKLLTRMPNHVDAFIEYCNRRMPHTSAIAKESHIQAKLGQFKNPVLVELRSLLLSSVPARIFERKLAGTNLWTEPPLPDQAL
ncbi:hypothetical protein H9P43_000928 [Blastocladiella emersonii ATCC 22665]|nr:hypothetical protein H9P43_000928 [Blastocladiella emersonii ATCC 22665]